MSSTETMNLILNLSCNELDDDELQALTQELCEHIENETEIKAEIPKQDWKGNLVTLGTIVLNFLGDTSATALFEIFKAYFTRVPSLNIKLERADGSKVKISAQNLKPEQLQSLLIQEYENRLFRLKQEHEDQLHQRQENKVRLHRQMEREDDDSLYYRNYQTMMLRMLKKSVLETIGRSGELHNLEEISYIKKYPEVSLKETVTIHEKIPLRIAITKMPTNKEFEKYEMEMEFSTNQQYVEIDVFITANNFETLGAEYQTIIVPKDEDSEPILFWLKPCKTGAQKVKVEFFQNNKYIGGLTVATAVIEENSANDNNQIKREAIQGIIQIEKTVNPPDLTLLITKDTKQEEYYFTLHSPQNALNFYRVREPLIFSGSVTQYIESLSSELETIYKNNKAENIPATLNTIGMDLYDKLFSKKLKDIWKTNIRKKVKSIQIISDEPWIPWEIIKPYYEDVENGIEEDNFLCEDYIIGRWISTDEIIPSPPSLIKISNGALIAPVDSGLPNVQKEIDDLKALGFQTQEIHPSDLSNLRVILQTGGYNLMHFSCHASFDSNHHEQSVIFLEEKDVLQARDITGIYKKFGKDKPFIFLNACRSARRDFSLSGMNSFADKFIRAKSSGFIGSLWSVNDVIACEFSKHFYSLLKEGYSVGDAMQKARHLVKDMNTSNSTWLAYIFYGDPLAKVEFTNIYNKVNEVTQNYAMRYPTNQN